MIVLFVARTTEALKPVIKKGNGETARDLHRERTRWAGWTILDRVFTAGAGSSIMLASVAVPISGIKVISTEPRTNTTRWLLHSAEDKGARMLLNRAFPSRRAGT